MNDVFFVLRWWALFFIIGTTFLPITTLLFSRFADKGYIFSKVIGLAVSGYIVFLLAMYHIAPFSVFTILFVLAILFVINATVFYKRPPLLERSNLYLFCFEEILFFIGLAFWSYIRAHEPSIYGLEKFMDFGFVNSILRAQYFPPKDMWFPPFPINYYYFGHYLTALLTKISNIPSYITFNLMIATLFSFTFSEAFSIGLNLVSSLVASKKRSITAGLLSGALISLAGNLHMIYGFFGPYQADHPVPFWQLPFKPFSLFTNGYWYPNATRFIPFTIHEFPIYSFVVSDLHGHVLDIPFVLFTIAFLYLLILKKNTSIPMLLIISLFLSIMYMTNAWDGAIYILLVFLVLIYLRFPKLPNPRSRVASIKQFVVQFIYSAIYSIPKLLVVMAGFLIFSFPFNQHFKPFVSGIGVICAPTFLTNIGKIGPFLFEANHCDRSPIWMLAILYGFFYFFVAVLVVALWKNRSLLKKQAHMLVVIMIALATILIIIPELIYVKDIYPQYYRANTMFKLVYQAFIMLSLVSGFIIIAVIKPSKNYILYGVTIILLSIVFLYPFFAINSYYGNLQTYKGLNGIAYLKTKYPDDYLAIQWMNQNIHGQPTIVEAQGDSYTDYERISANTGLPTVLGWTVHEWLWRGSYDIPAPRIADVQKIYESPSIAETKALLKKYNVRYVYIGGLERQKYPNLQEGKFKSIGQLVYANNSVRIYKL